MTVNPETGGTSVRGTQTAEDVARRLAERRADPALRPRDGAGGLLGGNTAEQQAERAGPSERVAAGDLRVAGSGDACDTAPGAHIAVTTLAVPFYVDEREAEVVRRREERDREIKAARATDHDAIEA